MKKILLPIGNIGLVSTLSIVAISCSNTNKLDYFFDAHAHGDELHIVIKIKDNEEESKTLFNTEEKNKYKKEIEKKIISTFSNEKFKDLTKLNLSIAVYKNDYDNRLDVKDIFPNFSATRIGDLNNYNNFNEEIFKNIFIDEFYNIFWQYLLSIENLKYKYFKK